jgi:hypothetical protein
MKQRTLLVACEENVWWVRLDGVAVVSFFGPHAREWAYREREELAQLLEAELDAELDGQHDEELDEQYHEHVSSEPASSSRGAKVQTLMVVL